MTGLIYVFCAAMTQTATIDTLPVTGRVVAADIDMKGNVYVVDSAYTFCKISPQKTSICNSVAQYGEGAILDADNPVEPMLFFQNSGMLLITDNNLNTTAAISLLSQNNIKPGGFGRSNDGMVWLFDDNSSTLKKTDRSGVVIQESMVLCAKGNKTRKAAPILDNGRLVAITTPQNTTLILNINLNILAELPAKEGVCVDLVNDRLVLMNEDGLSMTESFKGQGKRQPRARQQMKNNTPGKLLSVRGSHLLIEITSGLILHTH